MCSDTTYYYNGVSLSVKYRLVGRSVGQSVLWAGLDFDWIFFYHSLYM